MVQLQGVRKSWRAWLSRQAWLSGSSLGFTSPGWQLCRHEAQYSFFSLGCGRLLTRRLGLVFALGKPACGQCWDQLACILGVPEESNAWDECLESCGSESIKCPDTSQLLRRSCRPSGPSHVTGVACILATAAAAAIFGAGGTDACGNVHAEDFAPTTPKSPASACPVQTVACVGNRPPVVVVQVVVVVVTGTGVVLPGASVPSAWHG